MKIDKLLKRYRIEQGKHFRLKDHDPADTYGLRSELKPLAKELLLDGVQKLNRLQDVLAAQDCWGLLLIFQGMDAAGKDGTIKHVMSGVNPQGVDVFSFKEPSSEELAHDFLWRTNRCLPARCQSRWCPTARSTRSRARRSCRLHIRVAQPPR